MIGVKGRSSLKI